MMGLGKKMVFT